MRTHCLRVFCFLSVLVEASPATSSLSPSLIEAHKQALSFFEGEGEAESAQAVSNFILHLDPLPEELIDPLLSFLVRQKNREALNSGVKKILERLNCQFYKNQNLSSQCALLAKRWNNYLSSVVFYEGTSGKMATIRLHIQKKNCDQALPLLNQVEASEGRFKEWLELSVKTAHCLGELNQEQNLIKEMNAMNYFLGESI